MHRLRQVLVIAGLTVAAAHRAPALFACGCHEGGPVCEAFWKAPVVFVGTVEGLSPLPRTGNGPSQRVRFQVTEALRGTDAGAVDIYNYATSCHHGFTVGERWLIYAFPRQDGPGLTTFTCSRTRPLAKASEDLAYARSVYAIRADTGRISGRVAYPGLSGLTPIPGVAMTASGGWIEPVTSTTDREGRYEIRVPEGSYRIAAAVPAAILPHPPSQLVEMRDSRGCAVADFLVRYPGSISGRVTTASGLGVPNLTVELLRAEGFDAASSRLRSVTDTSGRFSLTGVEPGRYRPAVAIAYGEWDARHEGIDTRYVLVGGATSANDAPPIEVDGGSRRTGVALVLPVGVRVAQVSGLVVQADGRPAAGVRIRTKADYDDHDLPWTTASTDARGRFRFGLVAGSRYRVVAETLEPFGSPARRSATASIAPTAGSYSLRLVLR